MVFFQFMYIPFYFEISLCRKNASFSLQVHGRSIARKKLGQPDRLYDIFDSMPEPD